MTLGLPHAPTDPNLYRSIARFNITYVHGCGEFDGLGRWASSWSCLWTFSRCSLWTGFCSVLLHVEEIIKVFCQDRGNVAVEQIIEIFSQDRIHQCFVEQNLETFVWRGSGGAVQRRERSFERIPHFSSCSSCSHLKIWTLIQRAPCIWQSLAPVISCSPRRHWKNSTHLLRGGELGGLALFALENLDIISTSSSQSDMTAGLIGFILQKMVFSDSVHLDVKSQWR